VPRKLGVVLRWRSELALVYGQHRFSVLVITKNDGGLTPELLSHCLKGYPHAGLDRRLLLLRLIVVVPVAWCMCLHDGRPILGQKLSGCKVWNYSQAFRQWMY